ncbi:hypothetical protein G4965_10255 [Blautia wexlerae]|jgi:hypothetical protein|uniref:hypothetical protein n=1 Tax=Blautia wexlerae TaxID=418240 RepID=UPI00156F5666|nr:hypothetical protein [Blautia wexlerae]NSF95016.1 hypothetical protein [Blautia wexlerae]
MGGYLLSITYCQNRESQPLSLVVLCGEFNYPNRVGCLYTDIRRHIYEKRARKTTYNWEKNKIFADAKETHSLQDASDATGLSIKSIKQLQKFYTFRNFAGISCISFSIRYNIKCM